MGPPSSLLPFQTLTLAGIKERNLVVVVGGGEREGCACPVFDVHAKKEQSEGKLQVLFRLGRSRLSGLHAILKLLLLVKGSDLHLCR